MELVVNKNHSKVSLCSYEEVDTLAAILTDCEIDSTSVDAMAESLAGQEITDSLIENPTNVFHRLGSLLIEAHEKPEMTALPYGLNMSGDRLVELYSQVYRFAEDTPRAVNRIFDSRNSEGLFCEDTRRQRQIRGMAATAMAQKMRQEIMLACFQYELERTDRQMPF